MTIAHLTYVRCDRCGNPAQPGDDAREARVIARREGFQRLDGQDVCTRCNPSDHTTDHAEEATR